MHPEGHEILKAFKEALWVGEELRGFGWSHNWELQINRIDSRTLVYAAKDFTPR
jgi:hypothetical protein